MPPVGLIAELVNDNGSVKRLRDIRGFAMAHGLKIVSIDQLALYRQRHEKLVTRVGDFFVETGVGAAKAVAYGTPLDAAEHLALVFGELDPDRPTPVHIHRERIIPDIFGSRAPSAGSLAASLDYIRRAGRGILVYVRDGSPRVPVTASSPKMTGLAAAGAARERERNEHWREVGLGAQILRDLGITTISIPARDKARGVALGTFGIDVVEASPLAREIPKLDDFDFSPGLPWVSGVLEAPALAGCERRSLN